MRKKLALTSEVSKGELTEEGTVLRLPKSTLLVAGEHNGILFLEEEVAKVKVPPAFPLTLDHSRSVEDEVGWWEDPSVEGGKLRATPVLNLETSKGPVALGYVKNRMAAGLTPEVSVEVWVDLERKDGKDIARNITLDKASLVDRGACGPGVGCGVGLKEEEVVKLGVVPKHPWKYGKDAEGKWEKPALADFTETPWADLPPKEQKSIAGHFAWAPTNPPERYTDLKLPHHRPNTHEVVWNGVRAAMAALLGARGGVGIPAADKPKVYKHLAEHYQEFEKTPPEVTFGRDNEPEKVVWMEEEDKVEFSKMAKEPVPVMEQAPEEAPTGPEDATLAEDEAPVEEPAPPEEEGPDYKALYEEAVTKVGVLTAELEKARTALNAYVDRERKELIAEIKGLNPDYDAEGKSIEQLRELVTFVRGVKPAAKRKSFVLEAAPEDEYVVRLKRKMAELRRRD